VAVVTEKRHKEQGKREKFFAFCLLPFSFFLLLCALSLVTFAFQSPPVLTKPVNDFANVIDEASERELDRRIRALQQATGDVVIVATIPTFQPYADIREYAVKMFENAGKGIGERARDNGLLIVVAVEDRKVGIEVGYGLEPVITDGFAGQTIRELILPSFRAGQYGKGLISGTTRIITRIADERGVTLQDVPRSAAPEPRTAPEQRTSFPTALVVVIVVFLIILIVSRASGRRRRRYWGSGPWSGWNSGVGPFGSGYGGFGGGFGGFGGGGGGGGFGGFGGGRSGGGGASGGW
jgi:uncharacterized protein